MRLSLRIGQRDSPFRVTAVKKYAFKVNVEVLGGPASSPCSYGGMDGEVESNISRFLAPVPISSPSRDSFRRE